VSGATDDSGDRHMRERSGGTPERAERGWRFSARPRLFPADPWRVREDVAVVAPTLVLVTGMPSSGKTTVAEALARQLRLPLIAKDAIKESLYDSLGADDEASSGRLGTAAFALLFALARVTLASGASLIVEGNFFTDQDSEFSALPAHRLVQLHCDAPLPVLLDRYASRTRHPGHHDAEKIKELPGRFESGVHGPLRLDGKMIQLDTTQPIDSVALAERVRDAM
jgi:predicted kinase